MAESVDARHPRETQPEFKDRTVGLMIFGAAAILVGLLCALMIPLSLVAVALSEELGGGVDAASAWSASALYAVVAAAFVWLGVGSIGARRWARELLLSLSWIWLLTGLCSVIVGLLVLPTLGRGIGSGSGIPPEMMSLVMAAVAAVIVVFYVALPGLFVLFYRSPHVAATCRMRHPEPQWIDGCPQRLLTLTVVWILVGASVLLMPAYNFIFPVFGFILTGAVGAVLWVLVLAACLVLAVGTCRRAMWAWWGGVALSLAAALSTTGVALRYPVSEISALMDLPQDQAAMINALGGADGRTMAVLCALVWGTFILYLMTLHRLFAEPDADE